MVSKEMRREAMESTACRMTEATRWARSELSIVTEGLDGKGGREEGGKASVRGMKSEGGKEGR